jgi:hypothetical protein
MDIAATSFRVHSFLQIKSTMGKWQTTAASTTATVAFINTYNNTLSEHTIAVVVISGSSISLF